jgi:nitroreductase
MKERHWLVEASDFPEQGSTEEQLRFLVGYAVLAPSVHNTQPWAFAVEGNQVRLFADHSRCLKAADRDMRDLYVSLGCALENLAISAEHFGFRTSIQYFPSLESPMLVATITLLPNGGASPSETFGLFRSITMRRTNHNRFDEEKVNEHDLDHLTACCIEEDIKVHFTADERSMGLFSKLLIEADILRFSDRDYVKELEYWVRQGAYDTPWMIKKLYELACACRTGARRTDANIFKGASVLGVVSTAGNDRASQVRSGRVFERMFLRATTLGLSVEPITYVLQVPETRVGVRKVFTVEVGYAQVAFRLGHSANEPPHTPRRPFEEVVVEPVHSTAVVSAAS